MEENTHLKASLIISIVKPNNAIIQFFFEKYNGKMI